MKVEWRQPSSLSMHAVNKITLFLIGGGKHYPVGVNLYGVVQSTDIKQKCYIVPLL